MKTLKLFDTQPRVTKSDRRRLAPHLTGWNRMTDLMLLGTISSDDLKRLIIIESEERKRKPILRRLIGRLFTMQQQQLLETICHG
jgi:hypothetical protein